MEKKYKKGYVLTKAGKRKALLYKTGYRNVVITKWRTEGLRMVYTITHGPTGIALSSDRYRTLQEAMNHVKETVLRVRKALKEQNRTIKSYCKENNIERINF